MWAEDEGLELRFVLHDRDTKFTETFDECFRRASADTGVVKAPFVAPIANCYAESWIGSFRRECLNRLFRFSLGHLDHVIQTYVQFHNTVRPHQSLDNVPPPQFGQPPPAEFRGQTGPIRCQRWLGGLLKHYHRPAA